MYTYGIICITCISISRLMGGRTDFGELIFPPTRLLILMQVKYTIPYLYIYIYIYKRLPEDRPSVSKHAEETVH